MCIKLVIETSLHYDSWSEKYRKLLFDLLFMPEIPLPDKVKCDTSEHLKILQLQLHEHFCVKVQIINAFVRDDISIVLNLASKEQDVLKKKFCDISAKSVFTDKLLTDFWLHLCLRAHNCLTKL